MANSTLDRSLTTTKDKTQKATQFELYPENLTPESSLKNAVQILSGFLIEESTTTLKRLTIDANTTRDIV